MPGTSRISGSLSKGAAGPTGARWPWPTCKTISPPLAARGLSARSRARRLSALRQFFRFLVREEQVAANPVELLDSPRLPQRLPQVMGEAEVATLLAAPDPATPGGLRDLALLEVLYATGLRVSELVGLTFKQLDLRRGVVRPLGKGGKERVVPMVAAAVEKLQIYLEQGAAPAA